MSGVYIYFFKGFLYKHLLNLQFHGQEAVGALNADTPLFIKYT
jgi:hypothetical protein